MAHTKRSDWLISDDMIAAFEDGPVPKRERRAEVANSVAHILHSVGEDVARDGLRRPRTASRACMTRSSWGARRSSVRVSARSRAVLGRYLLLAPTAGPKGSHPD